MASQTHLLELVAGIRVLVRVKLEGELQWRNRSENAIGLVVVVQNDAPSDLLVIATVARYATLCSQSDGREGHAHAVFAEFGALYLRGVAGMEECASLESVELTQPLKQLAASARPLNLEGPFPSS